MDFGGVSLKGMDKSSYATYTVILNLVVFLEYCFKNKGLTAKLFWFSQAGSID